MFILGFVFEGFGNLTLIVTLYFHIEHGYDVCVDVFFSY